jgi:hypothetical protein
MSAIQAFCSEWPYAILFFSVSKYTSDVIVVPYCMNFTISTPYLSQETVAFIFLAEDICLNILGLSGECVCIQYVDCSMVSTFTNGTQGFITCYSYDAIEKFISIFVVSL